MDEEEEAARATWLDWVRRNDQELDILARRLEQFENRIYRAPPEITWEDLLSEQRLLTDLQAQIEIVLSHLREAAAAIADREDDLHRETTKLVERCIALRERMSELSDEIIRMLGEVGRAHDSCALSVKRDPPGAHGTYR